MKIKTLKDIIGKSYQIIKNNKTEAMIIGILFWIINLTIMGGFIVSGLVTVSEMQYGESSMIIVMNVIVSLVLTMFTCGVYYSIDSIKGKKIKLNDIKLGIEGKGIEILKAFIGLQIIAGIIGLIVDLTITNFPLTQTLTSVFIYMIYMSVLLYVQVALLFTMPIVAMQKIDGFKAIKESILFFNKNFDIILSTIFTTMGIVLGYMSITAILAIIGGFISDVNIYLAIPFMIAIVIAMLAFMIFAYPFVTGVIVTMYKEINTTKKIKKSTVKKKSIKRAKK